MKLAIASVDTMVDTFTALMDAGYVELYDGAVPASADSSLSGNNLLATIPLQNPAFGAASGGVATLVAASPVTVTSTGTCSFARWKTSGGVVVMDTTVGTAGTDLVISDNVLTLATSVGISSYTFTQPLS